jgi:hypothetical protein
MVPYVGVLLGSQAVSKFNLITFENSRLGHNPPDILDLSEIIGPPFTDLLK